MEGELPESLERKEHDTGGQTGEQNIQSDTALELAGDVSERDQAKEVKLPSEKYTNIKLFSRRCLKMQITV